MSPTQQISEGQTRSAQLFIQPDTEVVQGHLGRQSSLESTQFMGTLSIESETVLEFVVHRLHDLAYACNPSAQFLGPHSPAAPLGRTDNISTKAYLPALMMLFALKALVCDIRTRCWLSHTGYPGVGKATQAKEALSHRLIVGARRRETKACDHAHGVHAYEQVETFIPAQPVAPAYVCKTCQVASTPTLGIPGGHTRTIEGFIRTHLCLHKLNQIKAEVDNRIMIMPQEPVELAAFRQVWKGRA